MTTDDSDRLRDEIEQLHTALESSLEENSRLAEERDRLRLRVTVLARELHAAGAAYTPPPPPPADIIDIERDLRHSQTEEELRVAFEELQVVTEELEVANASLQQTNVALEARVAERTQELWRTSDALRISELAFRTLVEGMPQLAWRSHGEGQWSWSSPQWAAYTGQPAEEALGRGWLAVFHPDDRDAVIAAWRAAEGRDLFQCEGRIFHLAEQRYRHFQSRGTPVRDADGSVIEWLGTSTDVDALLQLQQRQEVLVAGAAAPHP
ncbi:MULTISPECIES: PAS domain-containing protein [unclassified Sphingomonas]|uniref:PAS domain-containing protein n=1 Tax=unclassified Sphingomonas TaxID=196159 RepID=UPI00226AD124|nr:MULTISPECIES: PAS domain-containing protein [unclassified Sphingomonas]